MNNVDLVKFMSENDEFLNSAAAAMYKVREPAGSKRLAFQQISPAKQQRNKELALQTLRGVVEQFPNLSQTPDPEVVKDFLAEQMYRTLAPKKSEHFPLDQRTPFARSYYRNTAEQFLETFLLPMAKEVRPTDGSKVLGQERRAPSSKTTLLPSQTQGNPHVVREPAKPKPIASRAKYSLPGTSSLPTSTGHVSHSRTVPSDSPNQRSTEPKVATPSRQEGSATPPSDQPSSQPSGALTAIAFFLLIIVILLVILVIRTF